jgi:hypothetical protein
LNESKAAIRRKLFSVPLLQRCCCGSLLNLCKGGCSASALAPLKKIERRGTPRREKHGRGLWCAELLRC